ncbi:hypothetical protein KIL84_015513 [Mauremys mutica]|uniref:Uncharacterized protein n=1 Tax=Mauremys mutica TaxID=74926 RepID=A0A9D3WQY0_9SAUR|nr:hypothetical protein KIL84_015513 [Mauremys mutica]
MQPKTAAACFNSSGLYEVSMGEVCFGAMKDASVVKENCQFKLKCSQAALQKGLLMRQLFSLSNKDNIHGRRQSLSLPNSQIHEVAMLLGQDPKPTGVNRKTLTWS